MKVIYQIESYDSGTWQPCYRKIADGPIHMEEALQNLGGKLRYKTLFAVLTIQDKTSMPSEDIHGSPSFDSNLGFHIDGSVKLFTEIGMSIVPYITCNALCYETGDGNTPPILDILTKLEEFRINHENDPTPIDWAVRMCEAIVAHAGGFEDRNQWTPLIDAKN